MGFLSPRETDVLRTILDAFRPADLTLGTPALTARAVQFISDLAARGSERVDTLRRVLTLLDLALEFLNRENQDAVRKRLTEMEQGRGVFGLAAKEARDLARFAQRLAYIVTYGTLDSTGRPPAAQAIGYDVFSDRPRGAAADADIATRTEPLIPAEMLITPGMKLPKETFDVVVIGSGSGGAVVARRLVEEHGLNVAVLEAGDYVPEKYDKAAAPDRQRPRPWDELENLQRYLKHAGLQLTEGHSMFVFQGECLGGSSVVNNAVCFRMPEHLRTAWANDFGIPWTFSELDAAYDRIATELGIAPADNVVDADAADPSRLFLNPGGRFLRSGAANLGVLDQLNPCDVNLSHDPKCLGCGYCNLICAYLRKRSVLQTMLPAAVKSAQAGRGRLTILTGRKAVELSGRSSKGVFQAKGVRVRKRGETFSEGLLRAQKVVVAAGAVASSGILERTEEINSRGLPIGERFSFNFGSPVHADFDEEVRAFDGLQIAHYFRPPGNPGFVIETWFNPPATQSLALPGWMDSLDANMKRLVNYACAAPLIGSSTHSFVDAQWLASGDDIHVELDDTDLANLKNGLLKTCELFFAGDKKPRRVLIGALDDWELSKENYRQRIERLESFREIQIGTGHPQGGNCLDAKSGADGGRGVVAPDFRVHATANVFVADASVFPTSLGVNPHWTVMAVADLAAKRIAGG